MNKQTEALKLALEDVYETIIQWDEGGGKRSRRELARRIVALAEQPAQQPVAMRYDFDGYGYKYIDAGSGSDWQTRIKDAEPVYASPQPAQQQEPVSVMTVLHLKDRTEIGYGPASAGYDLPTGEYKLYTSPPASKPWVGLTQEDWMEFKCKTHDEVRVGLDVAAKLREKNA